MRELINFCFKGGEEPVITITKFVPIWTDNKNKCNINKFNINFDRASLKLTINFLLDNCFFIFLIYLFNIFYHSHGF